MLAENVYLMLLGTSQIFIGGVGMATDDERKVAFANSYMKYPWIDEFLMKKPGVSRNIENWNWIRYMTGDKMFAAVCLDDNDKPYYITFKAVPEEGEFLRGQYEDIIPGFYMNKVHWNSANPNGNIPDDLLKSLLEKSYELVLKSFSKKKQLEITGENL